MPETEKNFIAQRADHADKAYFIRSYEANLVEQIRNMLAPYTISSIQEFEELAKRSESPLSFDQLTRIRQLLELLQRTRDEGALPPEGIIYFNTISIEEPAVNPFREAVTEDGAVFNSAEFRELDLLYMAELCRTAYREIGLHAWADALPADAAAIMSYDVKQRARFSQYAQEGRIPFFMPPASVQLDTLKAMIVKDASKKLRFRFFKPLWIEDGIDHRAEDGFVASPSIRTVMSRKDTSSVEGVPNQWYIMWETPFSRMINDNDDAELIIKKEKILFRKKYELDRSRVGCIMPAEYLAFSTLFARIMLAYAKRDDAIIKTLKIPDRSSGVYIPKIFYGNSPDCFIGWNTDEASLNMSQGSQVDLGTVKRYKFRLPVREIIER